MPLKEKSFLQVSSWWTVSILWSAESCCLKHGNLCTDKSYKAEEPGISDAPPLQNIQKIAAKGKESPSKPCPYACWTFVQPHQCDLCVAVLAVLCAGHVCPGGCLLSAQLTAMQREHSAATQLLGRDGIRWFMRCLWNFFFRRSCLYHPCQSRRLQQHPVCASRGRNEYLEVLMCSACMNILERQSCKF